MHSEGVSLPVTYSSPDDLKIESAVRSSSRSKLKVGLLLDEYSVPAWIYTLVEQIQSSDYASVELVVLNINEREEVNDTFVKKIFRNKGRIGYLVVRRALELIYSNLIARNIYRKSAEVTADCEPLLADAEKISVTTVRKTWSDYFHQEDIDQIQAAKIDILIRCGFGILRGDILKSAKHGVWSLHHGDNRINRGGPAGFWESMEAWPETGSILQILSEDLDNGKVLYRSFTCTDSMSVDDNRNSYYWKSLFFFTRMMKELHTEGSEKFYARIDAQNVHPSFYSDRLYRSPSNRELMKLTFKKVVRKIVMQYKLRFKLEQWILMFHISDVFSSSLWRYQKMVPPKDRFWADPHIIARGSEYFIFIEEYIYDTGKGHISVITMQQDGTYSEPVTVLDADYHLSYPFVFEHRGSTYMIPESMDNCTIELYECVTFPFEWERKCNLMEDIKAVDSTLIEHEGKWWLFANVVGHEGISPQDELHIFCADSPLSTQWTPHKMNPVVSDCKYARPAGAIYKNGDYIYRPSQNCSVRYGYGFNINKIDVLTEYEYRETPVTSVEPNWSREIIGTHTFANAENLYAIDALLERKK